jgi:hypothetical protein
MCENNIKLIYLTFILCTCILEKHGQTFLSENYEQTFPNKKRKQSFSSGNKKKQAGRRRNVMRTRLLRRPIVFLRVRCSI